jgi:hypothetical protein
MHVRVLRLLPALALILLAACKGSDSVVPSGPFDPPLPATLKVGDLVRLNVNGEEACANPIVHIARVEAIGDKSLILADTLNPSGGFTTADYQRYAAKFDTLVYPLDEGAFGAPTDIDNNGRVGIIFTRTVNELTPASSASYVGGFTFSRDLFPKTAPAGQFACPASNVGEFFYALAPDPQGTINNNRRSTGFVDSATVPVLAHELQHLINASRKLYINTLAQSFEEKWLDEGLAHIAEELLFYRESGTAPRANLDAPAIQSRTASVNAFNNDMRGNASRYRSYLGATTSNSPYAGNDSLATRGAAWFWLRYLTDQKLAGVTRSASAAIELVGPGTVTVPGTAAGAEYYATLVNSETASDVTTAYGITATNVIPPSPLLTPIGGATLSRGALALDATAPALQRDVQFEDRLRAQERTLGAPYMMRAREWYRSENRHVELPQGGRFSVSAVPITSPDADVWFRLANATITGIANVQSVFGVDARLAVSDWSAGQAVDDISSLPAEQFQMKSWNWHSIYPALSITYPLVVRPMVTGTPYSGTILSGGSTHFKLAVAPGQSATIAVSSSSTTGSALRLVVVRTK